MRKDHTSYYENGSRIVVDHTPPADTPTTTMRCRLLDLETFFLTGGQNQPSKPQL